jgi:hypothetical protein
VWQCPWTCPRNWVRERVRVGEFRGYKPGVFLVIEAASVDEYLREWALTPDRPESD